MSGLFLDAAVSGAYHLVTWVVTAIQPVTGLYAAALAIVLCTAAVRLVLLPLSIAAVRGERSPRGDPAAAERDQDAIATTRAGTT
jgi:hypothetical protein